MVIGVIVNCIRLYQDCKEEPKNIKEQFRRLSFREKRLLRREMKKELGDNYEEYKDELEKAILDMAQTLTVDEITTMMQEAQESQ